MSNARTAIQEAKGPDDDDEHTIITCEPDHWCSPGSPGSVCDPRY
ncbi:hypothetical protein ACIRPH_30770 [Nocardiopsis sp. NPDC101807]